MTFETLNGFERILLFGFGVFATLLGFALLWGRDTEGRRTFSVGLGLLSFGILLLSVSTGVAQRLGPDAGLALLGVTLGLFALSILWNLRGVLLRPPRLTSIDSALAQTLNIPEDLHPPGSPTRTEASGRLGLVLEGGGAKGAYAFGCIKAFSAAGLRFDAISGSSVGGLNAALLASHNLEFGNDYWGAVTHRGVYKWNLFAPLVFPLIFVRALLYGLSEATGIKESSPRAIIPRLVLGAVLAVAGVLALLGIGKAIGWEDAPTVQTALFQLVVVAAIVILATIPLLTNTLALSLLIPNPLRKQVERIASSMNSSGSAVYVTLCERVPLVDPDRITAIETNGADRPLEEITRLPVYQALNDLGPHERVQAIMASAALPVGVFPPVMVDGKRYSDGGEIDNVPVFPLMSLLPCDTLVVVRLRPVAQASRIAQYAWYMFHWMLCDRNVRLRSLSVSEAQDIVESAYGGDLENQRTINVPPKLFPYRTPDFKPVNIITIAPKEDLGGFFRGTLNFRGKKARAWMELGFRDALERISEIKAAFQAANDQPHDARGLTIG